MKMKTQLNITIITLIMALYIVSVGFQVRV